MKAGICSDLILVRCDWIFQIGRELGGPRTGMGKTWTESLSGALPQTELAVAGTEPGAPMQLLCTSGTTGDPKAWRPARFM